jgi:hypothetical protein
MSVSGKTKCGIGSRSSPFEKNSSNSSKPLSSDGPENSGKKGSRKPKGGKPGPKNGHPRYERTPFEEVDIYEFHGLEFCPACGGKLLKDDKKHGQVTQQVEVVPDPIIVTL